ncbi:MAG TPA: hypothetical protein DD459_05365 [Halieaceae bacterium]|jgi:hypothetical protein|nr:hypothetical protein [Halieaceae bacterium]|tara:strand:+ start:1353 stop:1604 length:252 start_codon:yes stop_codon:yes gene_type:complete
MKKLLMSVAVVGMVATFPVAAEPECTENCVKRMVTEYKGRPPFKRSFERVPASELASEEATAKGTFKPGAKPPYKRRNQGFAD